MQQATSLIKIHILLKDNLTKVFLILNGNSLNNSKNSQGETKEDLGATIITTSEVITIKDSVVKEDLEVKEDSVETLEAMVAIMEALEGKGSTITPTMEAKAIIIITKINMSQTLTKVHQHQTMVPRTLLPLK